MYGIEGIDDVVVKIVMVLWFCIVFYGVNILWYVGIVNEDIDFGIFDFFD